MFSPRTLLRLSALVLVVSWLASSRVEAQACHGPQLDQPRQAQPFRATVAALAATYDVNGYAGNYQGLLAAFAYRADWYGAEVMLPVYRLERAQGTEYGLGDLMVTLRGTFFRARNSDLSLGVELPIMVPTGDADRELGMGNVMLMPDVYLAMNLRPLVLRAQLGYGYMFGDMHMAGEHGGHAGHAATTMSSPLVNPMNMSELEHALLVGVQLPRDFMVHARWWGAAPIHDDMGVLRQAVALGASVALGRYDLTVELQRTLTGHAFEWKPLLQLGAVF
jgi:hypothetical protein